MTTLILAALSMATAPVQGEEIKLLRQPTIHDQQVVFNYAGDLWTTELSGGIARRLTSFPANESNATFSPDGKWIAFTAGYEGTADIYVIPSEGGQPKRITYEGNGATPRFWLDNDTIGVVQPREGFTNPLVYLNREGGMPKPTPVLEFITGSISADKKLLAYNRSDSFSFNWRRYRGGTQGVVSLFNFENNTYSEVPHGREQNYHPMIVGRDVYYISDKVAGTQNLYKYNLDRKSTEQLTKFTDTEIRWPKTDGKTIVFERGATLFAFDIASKSIKELNPRVLGDLNLIRPQLKRVNANLFGMSLSPSGQRLAVEARGDIFTIPAKSGDTRNLTDSQGVREGSPSWSPDGQTIAYISDKSGELEVYTMNQRGGAEKKLTKGQLKPVSVTFSPDSKTLMVVDVDTSFYLLDVATGKTTLVVKPKFGISSPDFSPSGDLIAFIDAQENLFGATFIYEIKTGKIQQITDGYYNDSAVTFDKNGKFLYIASQREYQPILSTFEQTLDTPPLQRVFMYPLKKDTVNPLTPKIDDEPLPPTPAPAAPPKPEEKKAEAKTDIDFDGLAKRAIVLPWASGQVSGLIGDTDGVFAVYNGALVQFDLNGKKSETILEPGWSNLDINPQRNKIAFQIGNELAISDLRPGIQFAPARLNISGLEAIVDPRAEWKQILNEGWRNYRDKFYDPKMVGVDWEAVRVQYNKLLPYCTSRADLNYLLGMMIGELGTGHAYVGGGDMGISIAPVTVGRLGATYEEVAGKIRIKQIFSGDSAETGSRGPLSEPGLGVDQGNYILAIDGKAVSASNPPSTFLQNKVGKLVTLTINDKPSLEGSKKVTVRPIADEKDIRYQDWVESNRQKVLKMSGGKIGYLHIPDTSQPGMIGFLKGYYSQNDKEAVILDERFNGGGFIPTFFQERLMRKIEAGFKGRTGGVIGFPAQSMTSPTCMLVNEYAGSGGDMLPWLYKNNKIGKVIGKRTWGGLVGIQGSQPIVDGGFLSVPSFGIFDHVRGEWIAESRGVDPDIEVDARPDLVAKGQDPQLEKAVELMLAEIKKGRPAMKVPPFPNVIKGGKG